MKNERTGSESLKERVGKPLHFDIVRQDDEGRVSRWLDAEGNVHACSFVRFLPCPSLPADIDHAIRGGAPIGETCKAASIPFFRDERRVFAVSRDVVAKFFPTLAQERVLAKELTVSVGDPATPYAEILELYAAGGEDAAPGELPERFAVLS